MTPDINIDALAEAYYRDMDPEYQDEDVDPDDEDPEEDDPDDEAEMHAVLAVMRYIQEKGLEEVKERTDRPICFRSIPKETNDEEMEHEAPQV